MLTMLWWGPWEAWASPFRTSLGLRLLVETSDTQSDFRTRHIYHDTHLEKEVESLSDNGRRFVQGKIRDIEQKLEQVVKLRKGDELVTLPVKVKWATGDSYKRIGEVRSFDHGGPRIYLTYDPRVPRFYFLTVGEKEDQVESLKRAKARWIEIKKSGAK